VIHALGGCMFRNVVCRLGASSTRALLALGIVSLGSAGGARAVAQQADSATAAARDSLEERLRRAEEAIELLRRQLAAQAASEVRTATRTQFELFGRVLLNTFSNSGRGNVVDVPQFVLPNAGAPPRAGSFSIAIRQSLVGGAVHVADVLGATFTGDLAVDLFGATEYNPSRTLPVLRLRTARAVLRWQHAEVLAGQDNPLFMGLNPVSLASVGTPEFVTAGNLWLWLPQIRVGADAGVGRQTRLGLEVATLAPSSGEPAATTDPDPADLAELSSRPFLQARVHVRWGEDETAGEIGIAGHRGWFANAGSTGPIVVGAGDLLASEGISLDARVPFTRWLELRGEVYRGKLLRGLGGGGIGQNFGAPDPVTGARSALRDTGGWAQLNLRLNPLWEAGAGVGVDKPRPSDHPVRQRNLAFEGHVIVRPAGPLLVGLEYRRMETTYAAGTVADDHVNLAMGFEF
jgi:hypothetical protein